MFLSPERSEAIIRASYQSLLIQVCLGLSCADDPSGADPHSRLYDPAIPLPGVHPKGENGFLKRYLHTHIHFRIIHSCESCEQTIKQFPNSKPVALCRKKTLLLFFF